MTETPPPLQPTKLRPFVAMWSLWVMLVSLFDAWAFLTNPQLVQSTAYDFARSIMSGGLWGSIFLVCGVALLIFLVDGGQTPYVRVVGAAALGLHAVATAVFGISILALTLEGSVSAITGATKWAGFSVVTLWLLARNERMTIQ